MNKSKSEKVEIVLQVSILYIQNYVDFCYVILIIQNDFKQNIGTNSQTEMESPSPKKTGFVVGELNPLQLIGEGGFGKVYRVWVNDPDLGEMDCALKVSSKK